MRSCPALLLLLLFPLLLPPVCAQEEAEDALGQFRTAMEQFFAGESSDGVTVALERLVQGADARTVGALADALVESMRIQDAWAEERAGAQQRVATSLERHQALDQEIGELQMREKAGERGLAPAMARKRREQERCMETYGRSQAQVGRLDSRVIELEKVRQAVVDGCGDVLAKLEPGADPGTVYTDLTGKLPPSDAVKSLYLVRILARAARPDADPILIALLTGGEAPAGARRLAISALAHSGTDAALSALASTWERQGEEWGAAIAHVLSLHAGRRLASPEEARTWLAERSKQAHEEGR